MCITGCKQIFGLSWVVMPSSQQVSITPAPSTEAKTAMLHALHQPCETLAAKFKPARLNFPQWHALLLKKKLNRLGCGCDSLTINSDMILLVKCHHASSDRHVHWNLCRHAAYQDHLLSSVGMESWVKNILGSPQFILRQPWRDYTFPARQRACKIIFLVLHQQWVYSLFLKNWAGWLPVIGDDFVRVC